MGFIGNLPKPTVLVGFRVQDIELRSGLGPRGLQDVRCQHVRGLGVYWLRNAFMGC